MDANDIKVQEAIINAYDVRPSTAYELMAIVKRMANTIKSEYEYGKQDATEER